MQLKKNSHWFSARKSITNIYVWSKESLIRGLIKAKYKKLTKSIDPVSEFNPDYFFMYHTTKPPTFP